MIMRNDRHILTLYKNETMEGIIKGKVVLTAHTPRLERRGFGERRGESIYLHPVEAVYLLLRGDLIIKKGRKVMNIQEIFNWAIKSYPGFPEFYFAYEDLRERGNRIRVEDKFLKSKKTFFPVSERRRVSIPELYELNEKIKDLILAVVDEESDVTYYEIRQTDLFGEQREKIGKIKGHFIKDRVITENISIFTDFFYGNEKNGLVSLSLVESLYLVEKGIMTVYDSGREMDFDELRKQGENVEENFNRRYEVYRDLKERNFSVKTGFKFGSDFRVYDKIEGIEDLPHSKYLVSVMDDTRIPMYEIAGAVRLAQNVRKKMIFAFKRGKENKYLQIEWIKI